MYRYLSPTVSQNRLTAFQIWLDEIAESAVRADGLQKAFQLPLAHPSLAVRSLHDAEHSVELAVHGADDAHGLKKAFVLSRDEISQRRQTASHLFKGAHHFA